MKKLLNKILKRKEAPLPSRITSDTVAEHRERILAGGRRFKYPIQYARHKLVFNAIIISVSTLIVVIVIGWWQLYPAQNTSEFMYRITKVVPVPVAKVDGELVLYSDYLMRYLKSIHYLEKIEQLNLKTEDGKKQVQYIKQESMKSAIADAYAIKLAKELNLSVSEVELQGFLKSLRQLSSGEVSEQTQATANQDYFGWSQDEYNHAVKNTLLRLKVSYEIDKDAKKAAESVQTILKANPETEFKQLASDTIIKDDKKAVYGVSGLIPKTNQNGGISSEAAKLTKNQVSSIIKSTIGDGYYIIRLLDINEDQVSYEYIEVPLTAFSDLLEKVTDDKKVEKYISL